MKARTTLIPVKFSRVIRFKLSVNFWNILNFGIANTIIILIITNIINTPMPVATENCHSLPSILNIAIDAIIGALASIWVPITTKFFTCVTSLVFLVIKLLVENLLISSIPNPCTLRKILERRFLSNDVPTKDEKKPITIETKKPPKAQRIIIIPMCITSLVSPPVVTNCVISDI